MLEVSDFKINKKYFITFSTPYFDTLHLRIIINNIEPKLREDLVDYITFTTLPSSSNFINGCMTTPIGVPLSYISKKETLKDILNKVLIEDIIYLIEEYI